MNIAFDMFFVNTDAKMRGIGRYSQNMVDNLCTHHPEHRYFFFYPDITQGREFLQVQLQLFLDRHKIDLFHILSPFSLFHLPIEQFQLYQNTLFDKAWFGFTRLVCTLYDVIPLVLETQYLNEITRPAYLEILKLVAACDKIYAISETSKQDGIKLAGLDGDKIEVVSSGYDPKFRKLPVLFPFSALLKYGLTKSYVLMVGGDDPRKNVRRTIQSFIIANRAFKHEFQLVLVYRSTVEEIDRWQQFISEQGAAGTIIFTGYVSDEELVELYNAAEFVVFPSLYEGLGLPVVEAMACETAVLASNNSSLEEIGGEAIWQVDPYDVTSMADGMIYLLGHPQVRLNLVAKGRSKRQTYSWEKGADTLIASYTALCRYKIALFCPCQDDVLKDCNLFLPTQERHFEVDIFTEQAAEKVDAKHSELISVYDHSHFLKNQNKYDYLVYGYGQEAKFDFITPYLFYAARFPCFFFLQDTKFNERTWRTTILNNDLAAYFSYLKEIYGVQANQQLDLILSEPSSRKQIPFVKAYFTHIDAAIVFNEEDEQILLQQGYSHAFVAKKCYASALFHPSELLQQMAKWIPRFSKHPAIQEQIKKKWETNKH